MYEIKSLLTILKEGYEGVGCYEQESEGKKNKNIEQGKGILAEGNRQSKIHECNRGL